MIILQFYSVLHSNVNTMGSHCVPK